MRFRLEFAVAAGHDGGNFRLELHKAGLGLDCVSTSPQCRHIVFGLMLLMVMSSL